MIPIFDATIYRNKPSSPLPGMLPCVFNAHTIAGYPPPKEFALSRDSITVAAKRAHEAGGILVLEKESPLFDPRRNPLDVSDKMIRMMCDAADMAHEAVSGLRVGHFSIMPLLGKDDWFKVAEYSILTGPNPSAYYTRNSWRIRRDHADWQAATEYVTQRLIRHVDFLSPSAYTYMTTNRKGQPIESWQAYVRGMMQEARRWHKPVFPVLWPEWHDSGTGIHGVPIPADYWREMVRTVRREADGMIVWGGYQQAFGDGEWYAVLAGEVN